MNKRWFLLIKGLTGAIAFSLLILDSIQIDAKERRYGYATLPRFPLSSRLSRSETPVLQTKVEFKSPDVGKPSETESGGKRGNCNRLESSLKALVPLALNNSNNQTALPNGFKPTMGYTTQAHPIVWVYVPKLPASVTEAEFKVKDFSENSIRIPLSGKSGIFHVRLPDNKPLELNREYRWYFSLICDRESPAQNPSVDGWIKRIELDSSLESELVSATDKEKIELYARRGIWHETITGLAKQRCENPSDREIARDWTTLLKVTGFEGIESEDILQCDRLSEP